MHRHHPTPLQEGHNPPPRTLLCSRVQLMVQPLQSCCSITKGAANCITGWEGTVGPGTHPSQVLSPVPFPRCSVPAKHLLAGQGLLLLHRWDHMPHIYCRDQQTGTSCHAQWMAGAKGRPQMTEIRNDTWSSSSPSGNSSLSTCGSVCSFPPSALG